MKYVVSMDIMNDNNDAGIPTDSRRPPTANCRVDYYSANPLSGST